MLLSNDSIEARVRVAELRDIAARLNGKLWLGQCVIPTSKPTNLLKAPTIVTDLLIFLRQIIANLKDLLPLSQ